MDKTQIAVILDKVEKEFMDDPLFLKPQEKNAVKWAIQIIRQEVAKTGDL